MTPPTRRLVLNWALIEQRRIAAGLSHAQLAEQVGPSAVSGPARLWTDRDHDHVRLDVLERLCRVLDLHPTELFARPTRVAQRRAIPPPEEPADPPVLEAALATLANGHIGHAGAWPVNRAALADALGWPLARLDVAVAGLDEDLAGRGQRVDVDDRHDVVGLRPRDGVLIAEQRHALHRLRPATAVGPDDDVDLARALYAITHPDSHPTENNIALRTAIVALQQRGLAQRRHRAGHVELTDDARFSLLLDPDDH